MQIDFGHAEMCVCVSIAAVHKYLHITIGEYTHIYTVPEHYKRDVLLSLLSFKLRSKRKD